ncbi:N-acetyltransferase family protein [Niallia sp. Krafla_26]|uniref:GNAT family N-acetyltransferase n=1 Tax=Niallia sp. Krafla_26 TaxID=3064703 RepID=UPI003D1762CC
MIREATVQDMSEILEIYNDAIVNTTAVYDYSPHTIEDRMAWYQKKVEGNFPVLVFEEEGRVVGFATYGPFRDWAAYKYSAEHSVYVSKESKGKGIGIALLKEIIKIATEREYKVLIAGIDAANEVSIYLHQKLGFQHKGTIQHAGYKFNRWLDLAFYQLDLPGPRNPLEK